MRVDLVIYDIEDPIDTQELGRIRCMAKPPVERDRDPSMFFRNEVCYILGPSTGREYNELVLRDISDLNEPENIRYYDDRDDMLTGSDMALGDQHLFLYQSGNDNVNDQIAIINDADPENFVIRGTIDLQGHYWSQIGVLSAIGDHPIVLINREALVVYSIEDIDNPVALSSTRFEDANSLFVDGDIARVTGADWVTTVDLSNLEEPEIIGVVNEEIGFYEVGNDIVIGYREGAVNLWDFGNPEDIVGMGFYNEFPYRINSNRLIQPNSRADNYLFMPNRHRIDIYDLSGAMGIPVPPEWSRIPDQVTATETDTIEFDVTAWDANDDDIQLELRRGNLPENAEFEDNGDGTGIFRWETGYDDAGEYEPDLVAISGEEETVHRVTIEVLNLNRAPVLARPLPDIVLPEDPGETTIADLDTIFTDPDNDQLRYIMSDAPVEMNIFVLRNSLRVRPRINYNLPAGAEIVLTCIDPDSALVQDTLRVTLTPVNDPPGRFGLIRPVDRSIIIDFQADFVWHKSENVDDDTLDYRLMLNFFHDEIDTVLTWDAGSDTALSLQQIDTIVVNLGIEARLLVTWLVEAGDGELSLESSTRRFITIPEVLAAGSNQIEIPTEFSLGSAYPNPFNLNTVIPYALPKRASIRIDVFSITGRYITTLLNDDQITGYHSIIWSAVNVESGMYFIRMQSAEFNAVKKVIFMK